MFTATPSPRSFHDALAPISSPSSQHTRRLDLLKTLPNLPSGNDPPNRPIQFKPYSLERARPHWPGMSRAAQVELARLETARGFESMPQSVIACPTHSIRFAADGHTAYLLGQKFFDTILINNDTTPSVPHVHLVVVGETTCFYHGKAVRPDLDLPDMSHAEKATMSCEVLRQVSDPDGTLRCVPIRFVEAARAPATDTQLCLRRCEAASNTAVSGNDGSPGIAQPSPDGILLDEAELGIAGPNDKTGSTVEVGPDQHPEDIVQVLPTSSASSSPGNHDLSAGSSPPTGPPAHPVGVQSNGLSSNETADPQTTSPTPVPAPTTPPCPSAASGLGMAPALSTEAEN
ncbi:hypothetical protein FRC01_014534 [Tulasnella sp. 417]|nr:hypothetical protein FRC01_014534 [Tulasnella sp. 417]